MRVWEKYSFWGTLLAAAWLALPAQADFEVGAVQARIDRQALYVTGGLELGLSNKVEEALSKGIPLEIVVDISLYRERPVLWNHKIAAWVLRYKVRYHALSGQYLVSGREQNPDHIESFASLQQALKYTGAIEELSLPINRPLARGAYNYLLELRASLDIERLPAALRPVAYTSPSWHLNSGWTKWKVPQ